MNKKLRSINRKIVSAIILSKDKKILLGKKLPKKSSVYKKSWHIPGGGVNENESDFEALNREILEETGIDVSEYQKVMVSDDGTGEAKKQLETGEEVLAKMRFFVYKIVVSDKDADQIETRENDDLINLTWFDLSELQNLKHTPPSKRLFKKLGYM